MKERRIHWERETGNQETSRS